VRQPARLAAKATEKHRDGRGERRLRKIVDFGHARQSSGRPLER
jgi:hypothetical protein